MRTKKEIIEKAYAKINLCLDSKYRREDGFHELEGVMLPLEFHDTIDFSILPKGINDDFVTCDAFSLRTSKYNLCHKMIDVCREKWGFKERFVVKIHKNIYLQAGLGGGSADASAVLRCIIKSLNLNPSEQEIKDICNSVGSDCLFQFYNKSAIVKGRGDEIEFFNHNNRNLLLIISPSSGNSTQEVFEKADSMGLVHGNTQLVKENFINNDLNALSKSIFNSLYLPAKELNNDLFDLENILKKYGFEVYSMTGSGSCFFAMSKDKSLLKKAAKELYKIGYQTELTYIKLN